MVGLAQAGGNIQQQLFSAKNFRRGSLKPKSMTRQAIPGKQLCRLSSSIPHMKKYLSFAPVTNFREPS
jgi:hypothetical protein